MTARARLAPWLLAAALAAAALPALRGVEAQTAPTSGAEPAATAQPAAGSRGPGQGQPDAGPAPGATARLPAGGEGVEAPALPPPAPRADRWRFNPRERTARGLDAWEEGELAEADAAFRHALALAPGAGDVEAVDPLLLLNAGTGRLAAGDPEAAAGLLAAAAERAGEGGDPDLATDARYNLGNARYAGGDFAAAAEAYRGVLHQAPGHAPAKHNLELALRRLAEQRQPQTGDGEGEQQPDQQGGDDGEGDSEGHGEGEGEGEPSGEPPETGGAPQPRDDRPPDPGTAPQPRPGEEPGGGADRRDRPLPGFEDQPDMTAEQAAAILEAVESLERQRRRAAAEERARRTAGGRDW